MSTRQRVLVTAGASGIGAAIARAFADDGARVSFVDIDANAVSAAVAADPRLHGVALDVSDPLAVGSWFDDVLAEWRGVDVLVNNAGIAGPTSYVEDISTEQWRDCLAVGLDSHFFTSSRAAAAMKAQRSGSIISISSTAGLYGYGMRSPYAATKWAVIGLIKSLAVELGPFGVRANAICPGLIKTDFASALWSDPKLLAYTLRKQAVNRLGEPDDISGLALFLCSDAASFCTGGVYMADGGYTI